MPIDYLIVAGRSITTHSRDTRTSRPPYVEPSEWMPAMDLTKQ